MFLIKMDKSIAYWYRIRCISQLKLRGIYSVQNVLIEVDFCQRLTFTASVEHFVLVATADDQGYGVHLPRAVP